MNRGEVRALKLRIARLLMNIAEPVRCEGCHLICWRVAGRGGKTYMYETGGVLHECSQRYTAG